MGFPFYFSGQYDQAIEQYRKTLETAREMNPDFYRTYLWLGRAYLQKKMYTEAIKAFQEAVVLSENHPRIIAALGYGYAVSGQIDQAHQVLEELEKRAETEDETDYIPPIGIAQIYMGLGEKDQAFEWLHKAIDERSSELVFLSVDPVWDSLRSEPEFKRLLETVP